MRQRSITSRSTCCKQSLTQGCIAAGGSHEQKSLQHLSQPTNGGGGVGLRTRTGAVQGVCTWTPSPSKAKRGHHHQQQHALAAGASCAGESPSAASMHSPTMFQMDSDPAFLSNAPRRSARAAPQCARQRAKRGLDFGTGLEPYPGTSSGLGPQVPHALGSWCRPQGAAVQPASLLREATSMTQGPVGLSPGAVRPRLGQDAEGIRAASVQQPRVRSRRGLERSYKPPAMAANAWQHPEAVLSGPQDARQVRNLLQLVECTLRTS